MFKRLVLMSLIALPFRAHAATAVSAEYTGYAHGSVVLKLTASLDLSPTAYDLRIAYHTAGLVGFLVTNTSDNEVRGRLDHDVPLPAHFSSIGRLNGSPRVTVMDYQDGTPVLRQMDPPPGGDRSVVPPAMEAHTVDTMTAIVALIDQVEKTGRCEGSMMTFDGRRVSTMVSHTIGMEALPRTERSSFSGPALRCDFDGDQLAGFLNNQSQAEQRRTKHGSAWLAHVTPGEPLVPVKVIFDHRLLGQTTLYMTSTSGSTATATAADRAQTAGARANVVDPP